MSQREETLKVLGALAMAFPYAKIQPATIEIYAEALADIPPAVLRVAGLACISRATFFPAISELRTEALKAVAPERPSPEQAGAGCLLSHGNKQRRLRDTIPRLGGA